MNSGQISSARTAVRLVVLKKHMFAMKIAIAGMHANLLEWI
jgi:hypothetical protein